MTAAGRRPLGKKVRSRQVGDLPRIGVAEPLSALLDDYCGPMSQVCDCR